MLCRGRVRLLFYVQYLKPVHKTWDEFRASPLLTRTFGWRNRRFLENPSIFEEAKETNRATLSIDS